ncbi:MAG: NifU family protein [Chloroflexota bacterium]|nr:NifU family protein [Chloroflexota bacterium]
MAASKTDFLVRRVLDEVRPMLAPDNGSVELLSVDGGVVRVKYDGGHNEQCFECVMPPDDFRLYLLDLFHDRVPDVADVEVTTA